MTPEEFDIDFDFDKEFENLVPSDKDTADDDDFDLDSILARELGPDFDELFEKEFAEKQAALNAALEADDEPDTEPDAQADDDSPEQNQFFQAFSHLDDDDEDEIPEDQLSADAEDIPDVFHTADTDDMDMSDDEPQPERRGIDMRAVTEKVNLKALGEKIDLQGVSDAFAAAGAVIAENGRNFVDALKECKPGHMTKKQKRRFKNDVLPILIGGAAFVLCLVFIIGALGRGLTAEERHAAALQESIAQAEAERAAAEEIENTLHTAAVQAAGYDYQRAMDTLDSYKDPATGRELTDEMAAARAEYAAAMTDLVIWDDPTAIPNLSFHVLIEDTERAYSNAANGSSYRKNFISTAQFSAILEQLHSNGYVLVNLDSCIAENTGADGKTTYTTKPILLPADKTPIMITETLVNYFSYMTDGNGDGKPDADGSGFASCLVVDGGKIKAEYIDADGKTHVGDYDLVPILNTFIEAHPDFSYRGAKAILGVTGDEGVFGWRTNADPAAIDRVKDIAEILRADGYQIASNSFANLDYSGKTSAAKITTDLNLWAEHITPILGEMDIMIIARGGNIKTRGTGFKLMEEAGFHYIIDSGSNPSAELNSEYFHQHRIMVGGEDLSSGAFDAFFDIA